MKLQLPQLSLKPQNWAEQRRVIRALLSLELGSVIRQRANTLAIPTEPSRLLFGLLWPREPGKATENGREACLASSGVLGTGRHTTTHRLTH